MRLAIMGFVSCLALGIAQAKADTIATFTLDGVTFNDGGTATGGFTLDLTTSTLSNIDITTSPGIAIGATYTDTSIFGGFGSANFSNNPGSFNFDINDLIGGSDLIITLSGGLTASNLATPNSFAIASGSEMSFFFLCGGQCNSRTITGGSLDTGVSATPLPAALPLFAGGLGMIGLISRRRKRKADAGLAAT